jgi:hypothetical protein
MPHERPPPSGRSPFFRRETPARTWQRCPVCSPFQDEKFAGTARPPRRTSGPGGRSRRLALASWRAARWTVTAQRAGTHPQARADGWRNVVKRSAAIAAEFSSGVSRPQPVAASRAFRIDALHGPSRQILHAFSPFGMTRDFFRSRRAFPARRWQRTVPGKPLRSPWTVTPRKKLRGFCAGVLVVSRGKIQYLVVGLQNVPGPLQPFGVCPQSVLPRTECGAR